MKQFLRGEKSIIHNPLGEKSTRKSLHDTFHLIIVFIYYMANHIQCAWF